MGNAARPRGYPLVCVPRGVAQSTEFRCIIRSGMKPGGATALVERKHELAAIDAALGGVDEGAGAFLLFDGEPGIGKSALLRELIARAGERHVRVLSARATPIEQDVPFGVAMQLFAPVFEDASDAERKRLLAGPASLAASLLSGGEAEGAGSLQGLRWLVTRLARPRRLAIGVDDVQWCDGPSLRLLHALAPGLEDLPLVVAVTHRPDAGADPDSLAAGLPGVAGVRTLRPAPLSEEASTTVVRELLARAEPVFCAACAHASGGNPYILRELVTTLRDAGLTGLASEAHDIDHVVPRSVASAALVRIARLGDDALQLAHAVAVLGDGASLELAARLAAQGAGDGDVAQDAAATADELAAVGVLAPGLPLRFAHPLLAAAVHSDMPAVARQLAHARAAAALTETGAPATAVAAHLLLGPRPFDERAVASLLAAGQEALARDDILAAERSLAALLEQPLPDDVRRQAETGLALAEAAAGRATALARIQRALVGECEPAARGESLRALWRLHFARGEFTAAAACAREAYEAVGSHHPLSPTLLAARLACATFGPPDAVEPEVVALRGQLVQGAFAGELPEDPALLAQLAPLMALLGLPAERVRPMADAAFGPAVRDAAAWNGLTLAFLAAAGVYTEDVARAERAIAELERFAIARGSALAWSNARHMRAELRFRQGRLEEAIADAQESLDIAAAGWAFWISRAAGLVVRGQIARGDLAAARTAQDLADAADQHALFAAFGQTARGELLLAEGDPAAGLAALEGGGRRFAERGFSNAGVLPWRPQAVVAAMALDDHDRAEALAAEELAEARRIGLQGRIGAALRARALATVDVGERVSLLEEAVAALEPAIDRLELANTLADLGALHARRGRMAEAREPLARAAELARTCGAAPLAARADAARAATGARGRGRADRDELTAAERQVAHLAAEGMTNREIAGRLIVTPKTVEWHLTHAYGKLGVKSRRELADALSSPTA
jgi:DNA-binding CsgD family transcriptional regulator